MFFTKQLPMIVTSISLIGVLAGCGSTASSPANNQSTTISASTKDASSNAKTSTATKSSTTAGDSKTAGNSKTATTQFPNTYNPSLVSVLKVDNNTLKKDLQSGKSLADIAKAQGVDEQKVIDVLVNNSKQNLDQQVSSGKMTKANEDKELANLKTEMKQVVEHRTPTKG